MALVPPRRFFTEVDAVRNTPISGMERSHGGILLDNLHWFRLDISSRANLFQPSIGLLCQLSHRYAPVTIAPIFVGVDFILAMDPDPHTGTSKATIDKASDPGDPRRASGGRDKRCRPPVFNCARIWGWWSAVETIARAFKM